MGLGEYTKKKVTEHLPVKKWAIYGGIALVGWGAYEVGPTAADMWHSVFIDWDISPVLNDVNKIPPLSYLHEWLNGKPDAMGETIGSLPILEYSAPATEGIRFTVPLENIVHIA